MEAVYITVAVLTGIAGLGGITYKCTQNVQRNHDQRVEIHVPQTPPPSPVLDKIVKKVVEQNLKQGDSDETDIDIKIHIQNHNHDHIIHDSLRKE